MKGKTETDRRIRRLETMRKIIFDTMGLVARRRKLRPDYGWIDTKLDAVTGIDHFDSPGVRGAGQVYSWIQGRGLEALTTHLAWLPRFSGYPLPDSDALGALAHSTAEKLWRARELNRGHLNFLIDENGPAGEAVDPRYTMSDLFCSRGLYAHAQACGDQDLRRESRVYLKGVIRGVMDGNFYNDQRSFDPSQYRARHDGRRSYAGQMLALGGVTLLMRHETDPEAPELGRRLVDHVLERHVNRERRWDSFDEDLIVEWMGSDGLPARDEEGRIVLDPGHALEFVGLAAQMILTFRSRYGETEVQTPWVDAAVLRLRKILEVNLVFGYSTAGGIPKGVDAEARKPVYGDMPWWSLPETLRAIALLEALEGGGGWSPWGEEWFDRCLDAFETNYRRPSACAVPLQTVDGEGRPVGVIPATPDLDPGYHTGLSLMDCHDVLARPSFLAMDLREVDISPRVGTRLSGHAGRREVSGAILDPLHARVALLQTPHSRQAVVSADLLELSGETVRDLRRAMAPVLETDEDHILVAATHTHTAPPVIDLGSLGADKEYLSLLRERLVRGTEGLGSDLRPVRLKAVRFSLPVGINRRGRDPATGRVKMLPDPEGSRDDEIVAAFFYDPEGAVRSVWVQTAVHPTTLAVSISAVSADYPGRLAADLRRRLGDQVVVLPFTGACGDVRPALLTPDGGSFRGGAVEDVERIGKTIADGLMKALKESSGPPPAEAGEVRLSRKTLRFPFREVPTAEDLNALHRSQAARLEKAREAARGLNEFALSHENPTWEVEAEKYWVARLLSLPRIPPWAEGELAVLTMGSVLALCMVPGELFSSLGKKIKALAPDRAVMVAGYANGSLGYLPGRDAVSQGGYEVEVAYKYYGLPGAFTEDLEDLILGGFDGLLKGEVRG